MLVQCKKHIANMNVEQFLDKHAKKVKKNRGGYICCCVYPTHVERTPSMHVSWEGLFNCWGCGQKGSFATLLHDIEKWSWSKAIEHSNVISKSLKTFDPLTVFDKPSEEHKLSKGLLGLFDVNWEEGYERFKTAKNNQRYPPWAFPFLKGFNATTLRYFNAGYDEDKQRITIPVFDDGDLRGFIGRACAAEGFPKYYIYPPLRTALYIYNIEEAMIHDYVILTEGPWDVWMFWQKQIEIPAVSLFTSQISKEQADILVRLNRTYVLMFDQDDAGRKGALEVAQNLLARGCKVDIGMGFSRADVKSLTTRQIQDAFNARKPFPAPSALDMLRRGLRKTSWVNHSIGVK